MSHRWTRIARVVIPVLALAAALSSWITVRNWPTSDYACTRTAVKELPASLVNAVNATQRTVHLSAKDTDGRVIATTPVDSAGFRQVAITYFDPDWCGFTANVEQQPVTTAARQAVRERNASHQNDGSIYYISEFVHGRPRDYDAEEACVSNTIPMAKQSAWGSMQLTINCDQTYYWVSESGS